MFNDYSAIKICNQACVKYIILGHICMCSLCLTRNYTSL